jgi:hypothetical protein
MLPVSASDLTPIILAPIPPESEPSEYLSGRGAESLADLNPNAILLDTSYTRTSRWRGSRPLLNATVDLALIAAQILSRTRGAGRLIAKRKSELLHPCLSIQDSYPDKLAKGESPFTNTEAVRSNGLEGDIEFAAERNPAMSTIRGQKQSNFVAQITEIDHSGFFELALQEISNAVSADAARGVVDRNMQPHPIGFGHLQAEAQIASADGHLRGVLATAETPNFYEALKLADDGIAVVRYCDHSGFRRVVEESQHWERGVVLAADTGKLELRQRPTLEAFAMPATRNRVIQLREIESWLKEFPQHPLFEDFSEIVRSAKNNNSGNLKTPLHIDEYFANSPHAGSRQLITRSKAESGLGQVYFDTGERNKSSVPIWAFNLRNASAMPLLLWPGLTVGRGWFLFRGDLAAAALVNSFMETWLGLFTYPTLNSRLSNKCLTVLNSFPWASQFEWDADKNHITFVGPDAYELDELFRFDCWDTHDNNVIRDYGRDYSKNLSSNMTDLRRWAANLYSAKEPVFSEPELAAMLVRRCGSFPALNSNISGGSFRA